MEPESSGSGVDIDAGVDSIARDLFPQAVDTEPESSTPALTVEAPSQPEPSAPSEVPLRTVPKSWPTEMHDYWGKIDPKVQEYWETREKQMLDGLDQYKGDAQYAKALREVFAPHQHTLRSQGFDEVKAIEYLLNAHHRLTGGTPESRKAAGGKRSARGGAPRRSSSRST